MSLLMVKLRRYGLRVFPTAARLFLGEVAGWGQWFALALAVVTTYIGLRDASISKIIEQGVAWSVALQAFCYVAAGWAVICLLRAPHHVLKAERALGQWRGRQFIYHRPQLIGTVRCQSRSDGARQEHEVSFPDAEDLSFVNFLIEFERDVSGTINASLFGDLRLSLEFQDGIRHGDGKSVTGGFQLMPGKRADLCYRMKPGAWAVTARVYCLDFTVGTVTSGDWI